MPEPTYCQACQREFLNNWIMQRQARHLALTQGADIAEQFVSESLLGIHESEHHDQGSPVVAD